MGSFFGHVLPGSLFTLFGIWWTYAVFRRYFGVLRESGARYVCTATFQSQCCARIPVEGICKIIASVIGIIGEWMTAMKDGKFVEFGNSQHIAMFVFYGINGVADVLLFYGCPLPADIDYMAMAFAASIQCILFISHEQIGHKTPLDVHMHYLLIVAIMCSLLSVLTEWKYRYSVLSSVFRAFCVLLVGTWYYQIAFTLHNPFPEWPKPDEFGDREIILISTVFCWHIAGVICFVLFVGFAFYVNNRPLITNEDNNNLMQSKYTIDDSGEEFLE